jgi:hypothetical protein
MARPKKPALMLLSAALLAGAFALPAPVFAGAAEDQFLQSYVGNWKGGGTFKSKDGDEKFNCRVGVTAGSTGKINYSGRCAVSGLNLSVAGTISYVEERNRYEAAMTSNATFSGTAVGRKQGNSVVFDLKERNKDKSGNDMSISSQVSLQGKGDAIGLKFNIVFNDTGDSSNATVTFAKM